ncbi:MAG: hypothetical protein PHH08_04320, partial [Candidatus ainarchaeum sp.]|nr:hypothetical protein [Candidatus ainarchaeum sp.]
MPNKKNPARLLLLFLSFCSVLSSARAIYCTWGNYCIWNSYLTFDTSAVSGTITSVKLGLKTMGDGSATDFNLMVYHGACMGSNNLDAGDWNACVGSGTYDGNLMDTKNYPGNNNFVTMGIPAGAIVTDGNTQFELTSSRYLERITPPNANGEYVYFYDAGDSASAPYLEIVTLAAAVPPDANVVKIDGYPVSSGLPVFSYAKDGNLTIDFNVSDADTNDLIVDINYSSSPLDGTGTIIIADLNLNANPGRCDDLNFANSTRCSWDWNISGVADANYYILLKAFAGADSDFNASDKNFRIDNTKPDMNSDANVSWQAFDANVQIWC